MPTIGYIRSTTREVNEVVVTENPDPVEVTSVYKVALQNFNQNDYLIISGNGNGRLNEAINVEVRHAIYMTDSGTFDINDPSLVEICPENGRTFNLDIHYTDFIQCTTWKADQNYSGMYLHLCVWFYTDDTVTDNIDIQDLGYLDCLILR